MKHLLAIAILLFVAVPAKAESKLDDKVLLSEDAVEDAEKLHKDLKAIIEDLDENNQKHFLGIYYTYSTLGAVKTVKNDVKQAVDMCAAENPDLAEKITERYQKWDEAITPIIKEAEGQVDNMIIAQDYKKSKTITKFLKRVDKVRAQTAGSLTKVPVTTPKACNSLRKKMDQTQKSLIKLLQETLISIPLSLSPSEPETDE